MADPRSQDFRFVFGNTFSVTFGPTEVQVIFGIQKKPGTDDPTMEEQVGVVFTHTAAKLLSEMLGLMVADLEDRTGQAIPLEGGKLDGLRALIAENKEKRTRAKDDKAP